MDAERLAMGEFRTLLHAVLTDGTTAQRVHHVQLS